MAEKERRIADEILALKIELHRELDRLYGMVQDPEFKGTVTIEINGKEGRPLPPVITVRKLLF